MNKFLIKSFLGASLVFLGANAKDLATYNNDATNFNQANTKINEEAEIYTNKNSPTDIGFKQSLMDKIDEKMAKIDELERKIDSGNFGGGSFGGDSISGNIEVPVIAGTTIIKKGNKVVSKEALGTDISGNRYILTEKNNNVIKNINKDYIVFRESKDKFPIIMATPVVDGNGYDIKTDGVSSSLYQVPEAIKERIKNSSSVDSMQEKNIQNHLR